MTTEELGCIGRIPLCSVLPDYALSIPVAKINLGSNFIASRATENLDFLNCVLIPGASPNLESFQKRCEELFVRIGRLQDDSTYLIHEFKQSR